MRAGGLPKHPQEKEQHRKLGVCYSAGIQSHSFLWSLLPAFLGNWALIRYPSAAFDILYWGNMLFSPRRKVKHRRSFSSVTHIPAQWNISHFPVRSLVFPISARQEDHIFCCSSRLLLSLLAGLSKWTRGACANWAEIKLVLETQYFSKAEKCLSDSLSRALGSPYVPNSLALNEGRLHGHYMVYTGIKLGEANGL